MAEIRIVGKYDRETGFDVTLGGLSKQQLDRFVALLTRTAGERFPALRPKP